MIGDVYKGDEHVAEIVRSGAHTEFRYLEHVIHHQKQNSVEPVATTLPLSDTPVVTPGTSVPAFFSGLLPEGRRLNALRNSVKTSVDDELSLLIAVGPDTIGDVCVLESGTAQPDRSETLGASAVVIDENQEERDFNVMLSDHGITLRPRLAGVQDKASAQMISLPAMRAGEQSIIKFNPPEYPLLVENEHFFLQYAKKLRINVVRSEVLTDRRGKRALLVRRFDRTDGAKIAVEDGAQVMNRAPGDKYNLRFENVAEALAAVTISPIASKLNLLTQLAYAWLTGNADQHAKNLSVVGQAHERLIAPVYDIPCTLFYGDLAPDLALQVSGANVLTAKRFRNAAAELGVTERACGNVLARVLKVTEPLAEMIESGVLPFDQKANAKVSRQLRVRHRDLGR